MEKLDRLPGLEIPACCVHAATPLESDRYPLDSVLTDVVLSELKRQSANGCLLCSLEALDEEEWE